MWQISDMWRILDFLLYLNLKSTGEVQVIIIPLTFSYKIFQHDPTMLNLQY